MKKLLTIIASILLVCSLRGQTKVTFYPQWTPQAQFAGFYVAYEKGFFADEGLDVEIRHLGLNSTESLEDVLVSGKAQIIGQQLLKSIIARADGKDMVNVMQITQKSGLCCVSHDPISSFEELDGKKVGRWKAGFSEICDIMEAEKGVNADWIPFINGSNLYIFGAVDATLCYSYNELLTLELAIGEIPQDHIIWFADNGYTCPEDGLYVTGDYYRDNKDTVEKFVRASKRGWDYAREHQDEALDITYGYINAAHVLTNVVHEREMLKQYLNLQVNPATGEADYAPVSREVFDQLCRQLLETGYIVAEPDYNTMIR